MTNIIMFEYLVSLLIIKVILVLSQNPCELEVTHLHNERKLECKEYGRKDCSTDGRGVIVPDDFHESIEKPASIFATSYMSFHDEMWQPYINITWSPPQSATGLKNLKGFLLRLDTDFPQPHGYCRLFKINGLKPYDKEASFKHIVGPVVDSATYSVQVWSLPRSGENFEMAQTVYVTTPVDYSSDYYGEGFNPESSATWTSSLQYRLVDGDEIQVTFSFGKFEFEEFKVMLIEQSQLKSAAYTKSKIVKKSVSVNPDYGRVNFKDVEPGTYVIQVRPQDPFPFQHGRCYCYNIQYGDRECEPCLDSQSALFNVTGGSKGSAKRKENTLSTNKVKETLSENYEVKSPKIIRSNSYEMVAIVVAFFISIFIFSSFALIVWKARRRSSNKTKQQPAIEMVSLPQDSTDNMKSLLVLVADDHHPHLEAVKDLLNILIDYCGYNVIYPPWNINQIRNLDWKNWVVKCLDNVDFVLLVTSQAASKLMHAYLKRETYNVEQITETGHLFVPMMRQVLKASSKELTLDKYITASFSYTPREFTSIPGLPTPRNFTLVNELQQFLCYMKNLNSSSVTATASDENNFANLQHSVIRAARFELRHVDWFTERFGNPYQRSLNRLDSGYHSVAPPRTNNISESSSPENQLEKEDEKDELGFYPPEEEFEHIVSYNIPPDYSNEDCMSLSVSTQLRQINDNYENSAY